jgi:hypothetical protein
MTRKWLIYKVGKKVDLKIYQLKEEYELYIPEIIELLKG